MVIRAVCRECAEGKHGACNGEAIGRLHWMVSGASPESYPPAATSLVLVPCECAAHLHIVPPPYPHADDH